ncbi:hypothetical protein KIPB_012179 [Kipferlia bialata]|uniref:DNA-directed RNA polymerase n=1 Tax=Kipferlia bialata TaxID=797122 RepID=A0A9K3GNQ3_9EUKA|nr:hypothetical protein KIPB_012179 [Kipferlia bialata]|eukprot:g12179.t1
MQKCSILRVVPRTRFPKQIASLRFSVLDSSTTEHNAEVEVVNPQLRKPDGNGTVEFGSLDSRLGISKRGPTCGTCGMKVDLCPGHFGYLRLPLPVYHYGFMADIVIILNQICKVCSRVMMHPSVCQQYRTRFKHLWREPVHRRNLHRALVAECKKVKRCPHCDALNGLVKKTHAYHISYDKFR